MTATELAQRRALMVAALGFRRLGLRDPVAGALAAWLDSWPGVGAVMGGMLRQGYEAVLTAGPDGWAASFLQRRPVGGAPDIVGTDHADTPWSAVQGAAWRTLTAEPAPAPAGGIVTAPPTTR